MSNVPPAIRRKPGERSELLKDLDYFLSEIVGRLERLHKLDGHEQLVWKQAAQASRRIRQVVRHRHDQLLAKQRLEERRARI